jgi:hypothetical protein
MILAVWTGPVVLSLIISTCALMGAAISIAWQIYTWRHNGPRVTVKAAHAVTAGPMGRHHLIAITAANDGRAPQWRTNSGSSFRTIRSLSSR